MSHATTPSHPVLGPIPTVPNTQALNSTTFRLPPLDGSLMIPEVWDWHLKYSPNHPVFIYTDDDGKEKVLYWRDIVPEPLDSRPTVSILAASDTITYYTLLAGIIRADCIAFPISPRNSAAAVAHLLTKTNGHLLLIGPENNHQQLAKDAFQIMKEAGTPIPRFHNAPIFEDLIKDKPDPHLKLLPRVRFRPEDTSFIVHSSAVAPSPENTLNALAADKCDFAFCVPSLIETWVKRPEDIEKLKGMTGIIYGGGPLNKHAGDYLVDQGVEIYNMYGSTESGIVYKFLSDSPGKDWEYMNFERDNVRIHWEPQGDGLFELIVLRGPLVDPAVTNLIINGEEAYATSDIFQPHPTKPNYWRIYGRTDDQIMHSTGEKTNPTPLELMVNQDPHVQTCIMFGRGRFNAGILVEPKAAYKFDPKDTKKLVEYRNMIWPTVAKLNEFAPQHSRIFKEMILVASPDKPFTYTAKSTPRRQAILNEYEQEIEDIYAAAAESSQADEVTPPTEWNYPSILDFVRTVVTRVVKAKLTDSDDIFSKGGDSLQATWIRNSILHALRENTKVDTRSVLPGFVYNNPTIEKLARYVDNLTSQDASGGAKQLNDRDETQAIMSSMHAMVEAYRGNWPKHKGTTRTPAKDTVLITGTTGSLGAAMLVTLLKMPEVQHIYALNRVSDEGKGHMQRQRDRLREWGYDPDIVNSPKVTFLEAHSSHQRLGLSMEMYEKIRTSITHIIQNGYTVNFNIALSTFEPNIKTTRNMIDLALSSPFATPPRLEFVSSIGVLGQYKGVGFIKEEPVDASSAVVNGYAQSKWVNEELLSIAGKETRLKPIVVRVGQVSGRKNGAWNKKEWFPTMIKSGAYLGCLPTLEDQTVSWVSVDTAADSLVEMRNSPYPVLHLAHPRPVPWNTIITPIARSLSARLVPYPDWSATLEKSGENLSAEEEVEMMKVNPALRILPFFMYMHSRDGASKEALGFPDLDMSKALEVAPALNEKNLKQIGEKDALSWLEYWWS
ncbi:hypothetical protein EUX98_g4346 [Antrodiella citrinella]|uniref:Thioester reductase (TE) domain-containing protein n=1 Tax=Antrodiella citrinella TaxID=2447956 RepID=A0A4S4MWP2_9APHY|nr:hypothetical protein EUX98_g4346 [Antrodiella citrinella]